AALAFALGVLAIGITVGDTGGGGEGAIAGFLGIFGVLKRAELDLRPIVDLLAMVVAAYVAPIVFARHRPISSGRLVVAGVLAVLPLAMTVHASRALGAESSGGGQAVARLVERSAPLGKVALAVLRKATDRDHD